RVRALPNVEIVRIGSRAPCTLPQRITPALCALLARHHPLYLNTQFNHPRELTPEAQAACARLADAGIPLGNQSVLLRGVNDDADVLRRLCTGLLRLRVRPYRLYPCQTVSGTEHFRTPIETGTALMERLQGHISGLAVPQYVLDTPYGKSPLTPSCIAGREGDAVIVRTWNGRTWREPNPASVPAP
ncbi:MAG: arginine 2,3-aminomutase, partial [Lentisphaerae bacterium]|nr:arginine 2,3-aminomutase [Lentisphaerota bacterium]